MRKKLDERKADRGQQLLMPAQNQLTRQHSAEPEHSGRYRDLIGSGLFHCACCGNVLVSSHAKIVATYEWPEFLDPKANEHIRTANDILYRTSGMMCCAATVTPTSVTCAMTGGCLQASITS